MPNYDFGTRRETAVVLAVYATQNECCGESYGQNGRTTDILLKNTTRDLARINYYSNNGGRIGHYHSGTSAGLTRIQKPIYIWEPYIHVVTIHTLYIHYVAQQRNKFLQNRERRLTC